MNILKCSKFPCEIHKDGKYTHWPCGKYSSKERHKKHLFDKSTWPKCENCGNKTKGRYCGKCRGKFYPSHLLGKKLPKWWCKLISDGQGKQENSPFWKGELASYWTKHKWIVRFYGNPKKCENCGKVGKMGNRTWNIDWANISKKYLRKRSDYKGLCRKCHIAFDK